MEELINMIEEGLCREFVQHLPSEILYGNGFHDSAELEIGMRLAMKREKETVGAAIKQMGRSGDEVFHVFLHGKRVMWLAQDLAPS